MPLSKRGKKYLKVGGALVAVVAAIEVARRKAKGGPLISRRSPIGKSLVKAEDVGWSEPKAGMGVTEAEVLELREGDQILVMEVACFNPDCSSFDGPVGFAMYEVKSVGPEGIVFGKEKTHFSKGPLTIAFEGVGYDWVEDVAPTVRRIFHTGLPGGCGDASPLQAAEMRSQGFICNEMSGEWVPDPQHIA